MKINIHFLFFLLISIIAILIDYLVYFTGIKYILALLISTLFITIIIFILINKKRIIIYSGFEKKDWLFFSLLLLIISAKIWIPDYSYDVNNYHIYLQENIKISKINYDFFAGKVLNAFLFTLGDRMHYIFRYLLGYRLGTILSYYSYVVIFYQFKNILQNLLDKKKHSIIPILSILIFIPAIMLQWIGTYYIDSFIVIYILEIITLLINNNNIFNEKKYIYYIFLLSGIATGIKITSIIILFPILLYYFIKNIKTFNWKIIYHYILSLIIFFIPFAINIYDNIIQTGSPLFPYYNNIFNSKWFAPLSWKDSRFGINNLFYMIIWPIYTSVIKLGYGDDWMIPDISFAIGYIALIITSIYAFNKKTKNKKFNELIIISIIITITWIIFLEGYMRYALIIPILYMLIICYWISKSKLLTKGIEIINKKRIFEIVIIPIVLIGIIVSIKQSINNIPYIFKDRYYERIDLDKPIGIIGDINLTSTLLRKNQPLINISNKNNILNLNEKYLNNTKYEKRHTELINKYKDFYVITETTNDNYLRTEYFLNNNNFKYEIVSILTVEDIPFINANDKVIIYKVSKKEEAI